MAEMKTLNGYEIVDEVARARITALEALVEQLVNGGGEAGVIESTTVNAETADSGTMITTPTNATKVNVSGDVYSGGGNGCTYLVFVGDYDSVLDYEQLTSGYYEETIDRTFTIPNDTLYCAIACSEEPRIGEYYNYGFDGRYSVTYKFLE